MTRYRIGRADTNDIVLSDATVSREHAELVELGGGRFRLKDFGSSYGTSVFQGQDWEKVTEIEIRHDTQIRLGEYQTTAAELLRDTDKTVVRARAGETSESAAPPAPAKPAPPSPPRPAPPRPPRTAAPSGAPAAPSEPSAAPSAGTLAPPRPAAPSAPPFAFLQNLPPEKRTLVWLGAGFGVFLLISLITLVLALVF